MNRLGTCDNNLNLGGVVGRGRERRNTAVVTSKDKVLSAEKLLNVSSSGLSRVKVAGQV